MATHDLDTQEAQCLTSQPQDLHTLEPSIYPDRPEPQPNALTWFRLGYRPMPLLPDQKRARFSYQAWLADLNERKIDIHWKAYSSDGIGLHCGDSLVVFDCDDTQSEERLHRIQLEFNLFSNLVIQTTKGSHHYYRVPEGVKVRNYSANTELDPAGIDVKCGNQAIVAPPTPGKRLTSQVIPRREALKPITQNFFDAVLLANGVPLCDPSHVSESRELQQIAGADTTLTVKRLSALLEHLDPDTDGRDAWIRTLMVIHNMTAGSEEGLRLADAWSQKGMKYRGFQDIEAQWKSFKSHGALLTEASLAYRLISMGLDPQAIVAEALEPFEVVPEAQSEEQSRSFVEPEKGPSPQADEPGAIAMAGQQNPFRSFCVTPVIEELELDTPPIEPVLGPLAVRGEITCINSGPNTGKTLITFYLLLKAIKEQGLDPSLVTYVNCDDSRHAFLGKARIARDHGFLMLGDGYRGFRSDDLKALMEASIEKNAVAGAILILDTIKKFVDVMNKSEARNFLKVCSEFCSQGGTIIALGHTNKNLDATRETNFEGTGDFFNDANRMWQSSCQDKADGTRVTTFRKVKDREPAVPLVRATFQHDGMLDFHQRLRTVEVTANNEIDEPAQRSEHADFDLHDSLVLSIEDQIIEAIEEKLSAGACAKTSLIDHVRNQLKTSKSRVQAVLDDYEGDDPERARWTLSTGNSRNAHIYTLIDG